MHRVRELLIVVVQVGAVKIYVAAVEALQNKERKLIPNVIAGLSGVLDFLGDVLVTTDYPDKCDDERDKLDTPKLACSLPALFYTQTLSLHFRSPFCWVTERLKSYFLSVLKERKKGRSIQSFMT
jgi:hypothetical protein